MSDLFLDGARAVWNDIPMTDNEAIDAEVDAIADLIPAIDMLSLAMIYADYRDLHTADDIMNDRFLRDCLEWTDDSPEIAAALRRGIEIELMRSED